MTETRVLAVLQAAMTVAFAVGAAALGALLLVASVTGWVFDRILRWL